MHPNAEGLPPVRRRTKAGLETPLRGRFVGEDRRLAFGPPAWYDRLVAACLFGGPALTVHGVMGNPLGFGPDPGVTWWLGLAVAGAGLWALLSAERLVCDLRARRYTRVEGRGVVGRVSQGSLDELDALVLLAQPGPVVRYRLVLHWKGAARPLLVVEREDHRLPIGAPIGAMAGSLQAKGVRYARALGVPLYDNAHFASPEPLPPI